MKNGIVINEVSYEAVEDTKDNCQGGCSTCEIQGICGELPFCPCCLFQHGSTTYHFELRKV
jgi:hypothetical protein